MTVEEMAKREKAYEKARKERAKKRAARGSSAAEPEADTMYTKQKKKMDAVYGQIEERYPKLAQNLCYFKEVWDETFPSPEKEMQKRMELRKKQAQA